VGIAMSAKSPKMMTQEVRYGVQLSHLIFPLDFRDLRLALAKNGYELSPVRELPPAPTRISFGGEIARKSETTIVADSEAGEIGVIGRSLQQAVASFGDLANLVASELGVDLHAKVRLYFLVAHYRVETGKMPLKEIPKADNKEYVSKFSRVMKEDLSSFSIRLIPRGAALNQEDWFDIAIEPDVIDESRYHIGVVFRNSRKEKTETFIKDLENSLLKLIEVIEA